VSTLERLRQIVRTGAASTRQGPLRELTYEPVGADGLPIDRRDAPGLEGATTVRTPFGQAAVIERAFDADWRFGAVRVDECVAAEPDLLAILTGRPVEPRATCREGPIFLDLETTGLSGGAGTVAFLVGCGWFDRGAFQTRQFFLNGFAAERALLHLVSDLLDEAPFIVTYNGRTFDVPVMETRWQFHRIRPPLDDLPHVDMLPPARRLWRETAEGTDRSCRLVHLEASLLGYVRQGDVPGFEIPSRYFSYVRDGDAAPLEPVLQHNRLDLLALAAITARAQRLVLQGPCSARDAGECLALGRVYWRAGRLPEAEECFRRAASRAEAPRACREEALHGLALLLRRQRRFGEAAATWRDLLALGHGRSRAAREAVEALAVHHEHRECDLAVAREFAMRALRSGDDLRHREAVRHRLARIDRKIDRKIASRGSRRPSPAPLLAEEPQAHGDAIEDPGLCSARLRI
jgi:tetratricopeptide (TPR) repeat protein